MFERFTDRARRVIVLAQEEARILNTNWIGPEHILLALVDEQEGVGAQVLQAVGFTKESLFDEVHTIVGDHDDAPPGHVPFTAESKKALEYALREALTLGHNYIGTEHILLGLIKEPAPSITALFEHKADLPEVRMHVVTVLANYAKHRMAELKQVQNVEAAPAEPSEQPRYHARPETLQVAHAISQCISVLTQLPTEERQPVLAYLQRYYEGLEKIGQ